MKSFLPGAVGTLLLVSISFFAGVWSESRRRIADCVTKEQILWRIREAETKLEKYRSTCK
jgi:hypothetical protein